ncbi:MAG: MerR family transcriptional regulator [Gammaproteobacteria bacterium]|nr:MerR family transcriptional regulator [Gammaproteobacteria bacterium]HXK55130.1 MerR family transcriptional regulator [Gammaproteobacteria bacterium]
MGWPDRRVSDKPERTDRFPIRTLSARTGIGASTLRAWERRYGLLAPERTPKGHRLYNESDVQLVERIRTLLEEGHTLSAIVRQVNQRSDLVGPVRRVPEASGVWSDYLAETLRAVHDFSTERVEAIYNEATSLYPLDMVTEKLIEPLLNELGNSWQLRDTGIAEEHFYAGWLRHRLGARLHHALGQANGARIICACLPGSQHEIGLMLFAISASMRNYRVLYLGADLPLESMPTVINRSGSRCVVLSATTKVDRAQQRLLAGLLSRIQVPLLLGGHGSNQPLPLFERAGGVRLGSHIGVALQVLGSHVPASGAGESRGRKGR